MQLVDFTEIVKLIVELMIAIISAIIIPWLKNKWDADKITKLMKYVDIGVLAAEQLFTTEQWAEKKIYVQEFLSGKGYKISEVEVDAAIESAVKRIKTELKGTEINDESK